ncbi:MAG: peptide chain release factor N(5)-glutamine methyltransferase [Rhizobiaceae bacterium]
MSSLTIRVHLAKVAELLRKNGIGDAELDARLLLQHVLGCEHSELISKYLEALPLELAVAHEELVRRRSEGEPVHRIIGHREFFGTVLEIGLEVLDPRPETELLVEAVVADVDENAKLQFADVGTGSGAIGISLLKLLPGAICTAIDVSEAALDVACRNAERNEVADRFLPVCSDYFSSVVPEFNFIVSNPPYIRSADIAELDIEVKSHDPLIALDGGRDGLDAYREIFVQARKHLRPYGRLYLEVGFDQLESCSRLALDAGWSVVQEKEDYAGLPRILVFEIAEMQHRQQDVHNVRRKCLESATETDSFISVQGQRL